MRVMGSGKFESFSAGIEATHIRPCAIKAMAELGIDITTQHSKVLTEYLSQSFDYVITVCDNANETCPVFPGAKNRLHWSFPDPSKATGSVEAQLAVYRTVRDNIASSITAQFDISLPAKVS